jgi:hypothetical protein
MMLAAPNPTRTSVIVSSSEVCVSLRGGAVSAAPTMPSRIALIARYS